MRDRSSVTSERQALAAYSRRAVSPEFLRFLRGATAALDWAAGSAAAAPVSGTAVAGRPTVDDLTAEILHCDVLLDGGQQYEHVVRRSDPHHVNGVEHALRWLQGIDAEPPVPFEVPNVAPAA
jgi:hypothetical protein